MRNLEGGRGSARSRAGLLAMLLAACVIARESPQAGGESHFLRRCDDTCGAGLDCIQGVCTRGCVVDKQSCGDLSAHAVCTSASVEPGEVAVCDVACAGIDDCAGISASHRCEAEFCRAPVAVSGGPGAGSGSYPTDEVFLCPEDVVSDPVEVTHAVIVGSELKLQVTYGGGCAKHALSVCFGPDFREEVPVGTALSVIHADGDDTCNRFVIQDLAFDMTPLADHYRRSYHSDAGLIDTDFGRYAFGSLSCEDRTLAGDAQVTRFAEQASRPCTSVDDCQGVSFNTRCTRGCGTVIAKEWASEFSSWLSVMDQEVCGDYDGAGCPPLPIYECGELVPMCVQGRCEHRPL